jgi:TPP-dependent pyruvate/acetoin dehydrogenase alpha subunit
MCGIVDEQGRHTMAEGMTRDRSVALLARMLLMRRFEEMVITVAGAHKLGRQHLAIGHEAVGAPALMQLRQGDLTYSTHRNHGHMIARGIDPGKALAEILGRSGGLCGGKGGTWHMTDPKVGFQSTSAMVGGSIGLSIGGAFALKHAGKGNIAVALFGDGVLDEGISYEAMNIASLFKLPVLFLCENNSKEGERQTSQLAAKELIDVPKALGIESEPVDGGDPEAVDAAVARAIARIRERGTPFFLEARLTRWPGSHQIAHEFLTGITDVSMAWDASAVPAQHAAWVRTDPILNYVRVLTSRNDLSRDDALALDRRANETMAAARQYAEASPFPAPETAVADLFV